MIPSLRRISTIFHTFSKVVRTSVVTCCATTIITSNERWPKSTYALPIYPSLAFLHSLHVQDYWSIPASVLKLVLYHVIRLPIDFLFSTIQFVLCENIKL
uniref:Uncharacterized protein n=1 Tax=Cucumis melo TaxID=3656 RepID=A0A9I9EIU9_CUCME